MLELPGGKMVYDIGPPGNGEVLAFVIFKTHTLVLAQPKLKFCGDTRLYVGSDQITVVLLVVVTTAELELVPVLVGSEKRCLLNPRIILRRYRSEGADVAQACDADPHHPGHLVFDRWLCDVLRDRLAGSQGHDRARRLAQNDGDW